MEVDDPLATTGLEPVMVELRATATPAVNTTVPSAFETGVAIERVFVSAVEEARVQVEIPEALEIEQAMLDICHDELGAELARQWKLPEDIVEILQYHQ